MNYPTSFSIILEYIHIHILQLKEMSFETAVTYPGPFKKMVYRVGLGADCRLGG